MFPCSVISERAYRVAHDCADNLAVGRTRLRQEVNDFQLFPLSVWSEFCQHIEYSFRVCTFDHKIGIDRSETHDSLRVDDEGPRDGQFPFIAAIALGNIIAEINGDSFDFGTRFVNPTSTVRPALV
jgi:hypothetical protein